MRRSSSFILSTGWRSARLALLGAKRVGGDADVFNRIRRWDVGDQVRQPAVVVYCAVNSRSVAVVLGAIDVDGHGTRRVGCGRVLLDNRRAARNEGIQGLVATALAGRDQQFGDLGLTDRKSVV